MRFHISPPPPAMFTTPSEVRNSPVGMVVGWSLPACFGTSPFMVQRVAWKSIIATMASSRETCTQRPLPVLSRSSSAVRMPMAQ